jgi:hypothetical protein
VNALWGLLWASIAIFWLWVVVLGWLRHKHKRSKR